MKAIIAVNNLGYIGLDGGLPWHCSEDLKHFKKMSSWHKMLAGWNTYQTLPDVVKKRGVICDAKEIQYHSHYPVMNSEGDFDYVPTLCIGGKKTYEKYCHMFTELHISHIDDNTIGDTMFPDLANLPPECQIFNYYFKP